MPDGISHPTSMTADKTQAAAAALWHPLAGGVIGRAALCHHRCGTQMSPVAWSRPAHRPKTCMTPPALLLRAVRPDALNDARVVTSRSPGAETAQYKKAHRPRASLRTPAQFDASVTDPERAPASTAIVPGGGVTRPLSEPPSATRRGPRLTGRSAVVVDAVPRDPYTCPPVHPDPRVRSWPNGSTTAPHRRRPRPHCPTAACHPVPRFTADERRTHRAPTDVDATAARQESLRTTSPHRGTPHRLAARRHPPRRRPAPPP